MARMVLTAKYVNINGVDLSEWFTSTEIPCEADTQESTGFASGGWREYEGGLKNWSIAGEGNQDYAAGGPDATLWPIFGDKVPILIRPENAARTATNPEWGGMGIINSYPPISGGVGDLNTFSLGVMGSGELTRTT